MSEYAKKTENQSRTLDSNPKASRQAPIDVILQRYKQNIQRYASAEEEEPLQGKFDTVQREEIDEDELLQGKFATSTTQLEGIPSEGGKANLTGIPDNLKSGIENLSGYSMDDVRVHYNSPKPAQLQALAYAQGTDIHIASGQEQHLPHEAWHVVQQKQGRVQPTMQLQGENVNDDKGLEKEADVMGEKALSFNKINDRLYGDVKNIQKKERVQFKYAIPHTVVQRLMTSDEFINSTRPKVGSRGVNKGAYYTEIERILNEFHNEDANNFKVKLNLLNKIEEQVNSWIEKRPNSSRAQARNVLLTQVRDKRNEIWQQMLPNHLKRFTLGGGAFDYNILEFQLKQIFRGDGAVRVNELSDDDKIAHMGWDSILKFKIEDGKFIQFETLTNLIGKGINTIGSPRRKIDEIITRGVDTCTVIFITNSIEGASAHLDAPKLKSDSIFKIAVSVPKTMYKQGENPITAVFSLIDDRKSLEPTDKFSRAGFVRELIRYYFVRDGKRPKENGNVDLDKEKDLITELKKSTHPNDSIEIINRGSVESDPSEIIIHPEIGFMFDKDYLVIFYTYTERSHKDSIKKLSECEFEDDSSVK